MHTIIGVEKHRARIVYPCSKTKTSGERHFSRGFLFPFYFALFCRDAGLSRLRLFAAQLSSSSSSNHLQIKYESTFATTDTRRARIVSNAVHLLPLRRSQQQRQYTRIPRIRQVLRRVRQQNFSLLSPASVVYYKIRVRRYTFYPDLVSGSCLRFRAAPTRHSVRGILLKGGFFP